MPLIPLLLLAAAVAMAVSSNTPRTEPRPGASVAVSYPGK